MFQGPDMVATRALKGLLYYDFIPMCIIAAMMVLAPSGILKTAQFHDRSTLVSRGAAVFGRS